MASYKVLFRSSVYRDLRKIPRNDLKKIMAEIKSLMHNPRPHGCEKLSAMERYRLRHGNYRIVYSIQDDESTVYVVKVSHRKDSYR
ncbi:MAG: type II toxin-antitoxin system RelE/ParE family toxin [bacterium]|nr:type II toxin-antitoxin system RelE/ParE family toxin [bacterium]